MTEPQKQDIVDKIIENTNVPVKPKPMVSNYYYVMSQLHNFYFVKLLRNSYIYFILHNLLRYDVIVVITGHYVSIFRNCYVIHFSAENKVHQTC